VSDQQPTRPRGPTLGRNPFVTALLVLIGIVLLLPGLCSLIFTGMMVTHGGGSGDFLGLVIFGFLVGAVGVALIMHAIRR
jgi:hypothetical protein